jgi:hypothetical protein
VRVLVYEAIPPVNPVTVFALASLFALCALIVLIGIIKSVDAVSRAFFGSLGSSVGWIPGVGGLVKRSVHRIEQKISHILGTAEQKLEVGVSWTWNNCAHIIMWVGSEIEAAAKTSWHLAQQAKAFVRRREVTHEIKSAVTPVKAQAAGAARVGRLARDEAKAVHHSVAQGVYPRLKVGEHERAHVLNPGVASARAQARAAEEAAIATYRYIVRHRRSVIAGAFTGAVAWALTRVGGGWIRCKNWRAIGKRVCGIPWSTIESLLAIGLATELVIDPEKVAEAALLAVDGLEGVIEKIAE